MRIAILFDHLGPYHLARLRAVAPVAELLAIEVRGRSKEYAWDVSSVRESFRCETLLPKGSNGEPDGSSLRRRLAEVLLTFAPDVCAVPGWSSRAAFAATHYCRKAGVPVVVMADSTAHDEPRVAWKEEIKRSYLRNTASAFAAGRLHADYLVQLGMPRGRIFLGYDVVDNEYFARETDRLREKVAGHSHPPYFLVSARFIEKKNLPFILKAYAGYRARTESKSSSEWIWDLVILGDGPLRVELEAQISALRLQPYVRCPGFVQYPELPVYYASAGALIHASTTEQWGLVVNEAMASGLPVLVSDRCGCAPDLVEENVNGWTFNPSDEAALMALLGKIAAAEFPRAQFGAASRRIIGNWGPERFAHGLLHAAETAINAAPRSTALWDRFLLSVLMRR